VLVSCFRFSVFRMLKNPAAGLLAGLAFRLMAETWEIGDAA
jgi:hypothetical protein